MNCCSAQLMIALVVSLSGAIALSGNTGHVAIAQSTTEMSAQTDVAALLEEGDRFYQQSIQQFQVNQFEATLSFGQPSLDIYRSSSVRDAFPRKSRRGESLVLQVLSTTYFNLGQYQQAIDLDEQSLVISRELGDRAEEGRVLKSLGSAYNNLGQYWQAIDLYEQSLVIARGLGNRAEESTALVALGRTYNNLGQYQQAIDLYEQGLTITSDLGDRAGEVNALVALGVVYDDLGQYQQAIDFYKQSLAIASDLGDRAGEGTVLMALGRAYNNLGQYQQAIYLYEQSLVIAREIGDYHGQSDAFGNLGIAHSRMGQHQQAIDFYEQELAISLDLGARGGQSVALGNLGVVYSVLGQYQQAIDFYEQSLVIAREIGDRQGEAHTLNNLGSLLLQGSQYKQAEFVLSQSINVYESLRIDLFDDQLISLIDTQQKAYSHLNRALVAQGKVDDALLISERGRAQALALKLMRHFSLVSGVAETPSDFAAFEDFALSHIQQVTHDTNITVVEYTLIPNRVLYIWVIQPSGQIDFRSVDLHGEDDPAFTTLVSLNSPLYRGTSEPSQLDTLVADTHSALNTATIVVRTKEQTDRLQKLHKLLIDPIADLLPTDPNAKVAFIPQGSLFHVPFPALQDDDGTYLIEKHTILTAPSIQVLGLAHDTAQERETLSLVSNPLIVGNPAMPEVALPTPNGIVTDQLSPLPGAEEEAIAIATALNTTALTHHHATEATVKQQLSTASLIHLATHGLLDYGESPLDIPGAIALSSTATEDGLLTSGEIIDMDLQADLAILSACDTGLGTITGDGVVGLSRALITAGVPSVVVSLWSVPDAPTAELMQEFYAQLEQGQSKAQALRRAMLTTMQSHPDPRNWAAFTLIGNS